jgi:hypothetical protein
LAKGGFRVERGYDPSVRIPQVILKSVAFIGEVTHEDSSGLSGDLCATGFFVAVPFVSPELSHSSRFFYFVTAAHVAKHLSDRPIYFLVNKRGGGVTGISKVLDSDWWVHPTDRTADLGIVHVGRQEEADILAVAVDDFVTKDDIDNERVGIGDEVFVTGLFTEAPGVSRNMPLVRHGNIAMIPEDQIQTELGYADVYLVEARSIGGLSGSPVFVRPTVNVELGDQTAYGVGSTKLLGLMHGHWDIREAQMNNPTVIQNRRSGVNLGIGIVVPAAKILETIYRPDLVEFRMSIEEEILRKGVLETDLAKPKRE